MLLRCPSFFSTVPTIAYAKSLGRIPGGHFWAGSFSMLSLRGGGFKYWLYIFTLVGEDLTNLFHLTWNHHLRPSLISVFSYFFHISDSCIGDRVCSRAIRWRFLSHFQRSSFAAASADAHGLAQEMQKLRTEHQEAEKRNDTLEKQMQEDLFWVMNIDVEKIARGIPIMQFGGWLIPKKSILMNDTQPREPTVGPWKLVLWRYSFPFGARPICIHRAVSC